MSWWQFEMLLAGAWLITMYISFRAGQRYQQFRKNVDEVAVDEKKRFPDEVFLLQKSTVMHLSSTCSYFNDKAEPATLSWCIRCSWKNQKREGKKV